MFPVVVLTMTPSAFQDILILAKNVSEQTDASNANPRTHYSRDVSIVRNRPCLSLEFDLIFPLKDT